MAGEIVRQDSIEHGAEGIEVAVDPARVREELRRIVASRHFQASRRSKEFLQYVVNQKNGGKGDLLKERLIGADIFGRAPDYSTGEDPVVRVQAGDVRRRLERYYADPATQSDVLISLPLGSYSPVFTLKASLSTKRPPAVRQDVSFFREDGLTDNEQLPEMEGSPSGFDASMPARTATEHRLDLLEAVQASRFVEQEASERVATEPPGGTRAGWIGPDRRYVALAALVCLALFSYLVVSHLHTSSQSILKGFWAPTSLSSKPVLLCLPRPMVYRPSDKLFDRYEKTHPGTLSTREARQDHILPLDPTETIQWGDMVPAYNSGPGMGGVVAAVNISRLLTEQGIRFELRFGEEATYADMRESPVVLVGAINTNWTTDLTSELNFVFDERRDAPNIRERGGFRRVWKMETNAGQITRDYGMITRQISGKTGQFLVQVAGVSHFGTEAASEFLTNKAEFARALNTESISLQKRNIQIVVSTDITAGRAGPPHVVATTSW